MSVCRAMYPRARPQIYGTLTFAHFLLRAINVSMICHNKRTSRNIGSQQNDKTFFTFQVCSNKNLTFDSECHMDREACWCRRRKPQCGNPSFRTLRLDYYGECKRKTRSPLLQKLRLSSRSLLENTMTMINVLLQSLQNARISKWSSFLFVCPTGSSK